MCPETNLETNQFAKADITPLNMGILKNKELSLYRGRLVFFWLTGMIFGFFVSFLLGNFYNIITLLVFTLPVTLLFVEVLVPLNVLAKKCLAYLWFLFVGLLIGLTIASISISTAPVKNGLVWVILIVTPLVFGMKWSERK